MSLAYLIPYTQGATIPHRIIEARGVRSTLVKHPLLQGEWPKYLVTLDEFGVNIDTLDVAYTAALQRGKDRIAARTQADNVVKANMVSLAKHAELVAGNDLNVLRTFGFPLRQIHQRSTVQPVVQPVVMLEHGKDPNTIVVKISKVTGVTSFAVFLTDGTPADEAQWKYVDSFKSNTIILKGLTAGTVYSVRVCCIGPNGSGPCSIPVSLMSL